MSADLYSFFDVARHVPEDVCTPPWRAMSELAVASAAWQQRIAATRAALGSAAGISVDDVEPRVAASVVHLGICARIIAPVLAAAVIDGIVIETALARMWWQPTLGGPFPLSVQRAQQHGSSADVPRILREVLLDATMASVVRAVREYSVSTHIAWGNVASALHSAAAMLVVAHPEHAAATSTLLESLAAYRPVAAAGDSVRGEGFRRNSCCLIYRVAGDQRAAVCGDCIFIDHQTSPSRQSQVISPSRSSGPAPGNT